MDAGTESIRDYYNSLAPAYFIHFDSRIHKGETLFLQTFLTVLERGSYAIHRTLDLGCGEGLGYDLLLEGLGRHPFHMPRYVGLDLSPEMIKAARKLHPQHSTGNPLFLEADLNTLGKPDIWRWDLTNMDLITGYWVLNYIQDLPRLVRQVRYMLRSGGIFLFTLYSPEGSHRAPPLVDGETYIRYTPYAADLRNAFKGFSGQWGGYSSKRGPHVKGMTCLQEFAGEEDTVEPEYVSRRLWRQIWGREEWTGKPPDSTLHAHQSLIVWGMK